jgi:hypothetical protein
LRRRRAFLSAAGQTGCGAGAAEAAPVCAAPGSPLDEQTLMGPLANRQQFEKVLQLIETARDEGDTIVCGGEALPGDGYFVLPTAVKVRSEKSTLMRRRPSVRCAVLSAIKVKRRRWRGLTLRRLAWRPASGRIIFAGAALFRGD